MDIYETTRVTSSPPLIIDSGHPLHDFDFSPHHPALLVTASKVNGTIQLWKAPTKDIDHQNDLFIRMSQPLLGITSHQKSIETFAFHPIFSDLIASTSSDGTIKFWSLTGSNLEKLSVDHFKNDTEYVTQLAFNTLGEHFAGMTNQARLATIDPRLPSSSCLTSFIDTGHISTKQSQLTWAHPNSMIVTTGFSKASIRQVKLWDQRNLRDCAQSINLGSGVASFQLFWDSALPLLYLTARNEQITVFEQQNGNLRYAADIPIERPATGYAILPKHICNIAKCEIARFLTLSCENCIEYTSLQVPRINSETVFQKDLYPEIELISLDYPGGWTDGLERIEKAAKRLYVDGFSNEELPSLNIPLSSALPRTIAEKAAHCHESLSEQVSFKSLNASGKLEQRGWIFSNWIPVFLRLRDHWLYMTNSNDNTAILMVKPEDLQQVSSTSNPQNGISFTFCDKEYRLQMDSLDICVEWVDELTNRIVNAASKPLVGSRENSMIHIGKMRLLNRDDLLLSYQCPERTVVLQKGAVMCIYKNEKSYHDKGLPLEILCLDNLIGLHPISLVASPCPSSSLPANGRLPLSLFKMMFDGYSYVFFTKCQTQMAFWIQKIKNSLPLSVAERVPRDSPPSFLVSVVTEIDNSVESTERRLWMTLLTDRFVYANSTFSSHYVTVRRFESIREVKIVGDQNIGRAVEVVNQDETVSFHTFQSARQAKEFLEAIDWMKRESQDIAKDIGFSSTEDMENEAMTFCHVYRDRNITFLPDISASYPYLLRISGQHNVTYVSPIYTSLTANDCFVYRNKEHIYHWRGSSSSRVCRAISLDIASRIIKYHKDNLKLIIAEESDPHSVNNYYKELGTISDHPMLDLFGLRELPVTKVFEMDSRANKPIALISSVACPSKEILLPDKSYVVQFNNIYFSWSGAKSSSKDGMFAMAVAKRMAELDKGIVCLTFLKEGFEHPIFCEAFKDYQSDLPISLKCKEVKSGNVLKRQQAPVDITGLLKYHGKVMLSGINDRPVKTEIFRVSHFQKIKVPESDWGFFCSNESYLITYVYRPTSTYVTKTIAYLYQGQKSPVIEQGTAAMLTVEATKDVHEDVRQVRVEQGKEPREFALLFDYLVIFHTDFLGLEEECTLVFDVRTSRDGTCRASQVASPEDICWSANCVLVFCIPIKAYLWTGEFSTDDERVVANSLATRLGCRTVVEFDKENFRTVQEDLKSRSIEIPAFSRQLCPVRFLPRLFSVSGATGIVQIHEVEQFGIHDVFRLCILDVMNTVYIWIDEAVATVDEKRIAIQSMQDYANASHSSRGINPKVRITFFGLEPDAFREAFQGFPIPARGHDSVEISADEYLAEVLDKSVYPIQTLLSESSPKHVDRTRLESYLSQEEFQSTFQMARQDYFSLPPWKRDNLKKSAGLF